MGADSGEKSGDVCAKHVFEPGRLKDFAFVKSLHRWNAGRTTTIPK